VIIFSNMGRAVPASEKPRTIWQVSYYGEDVDPGHPLGVAWVLDNRPFPPDSATFKLWRPNLRYLFVVDAYRRQGVATKLLRACLRRWPDLDYEGVTDAGIAFEEAFDAGMPSLSS
jgi:GNAT superfamily N-acetyltransferase